MKKFLIILFASLLFSCSQSLSAMERTPLKVEIKGNVFTGYLYDSKTSRELLESFPLTLEMKELNGNEKYAYLDKDYDTDSERVGQIHEGDLMLLWK